MIATGDGIGLGTYLGVRRMCKTMGLFLSVCLVSPGLGDVAGKASGEKLDGMSILKKSEAAMKRAHRVSYRAEYKATGWVTKFVPEVEGSAVVGKRSKWDIEPFRCEVKIHPRESSETLEFSAGSDGDVFYLIDPKTRMVYEDMDPGVLGEQGHDIQRVVMKELAAPDPFGEKLSPDSITLEGTETIAGEACHEIHIKSDSPPEMVWYISTKDYLPRRVRRIYPDRDDPKADPGTTELTISDVVVESKAAGALFKLVVPEGFTRSDDFAP